MYMEQTAGEYEMQQAFVYMQMSASFHLRFRVNVFQCNMISEQLSAGIGITVAKYYTD